MWERLIHQDGTVMLRNGSEERVSFEPVVSIGSPNPLHESLLPKDVLRGPVRRLGNCQPVSLTDGVCEAVRHKLLSNASSTESFRYSQQKEVGRFAGDAYGFAPVCRLQLAEDIEDRFELSAEAMGGSRQW